MEYLALKAATKSLESFFLAFKKKMRKVKVRVDSVKGKITFIKGKNTYQICSRPFTTHYGDYLRDESGKLLRGKTGKFILDPTKVKQHYLDPLCNQDVRMISLFDEEVEERYRSLSDPEKEAFQAFLSLKPQLTMVAAQKDLAQVHFFLEGEEILQEQMSFSSLFSQQEKPSSNALLVQKDAQGNALDALKYKPPFYEKLLGKLLNKYCY